jgi:DNA-binding winged helix-turn-helix (wHTH) protein/tetratricopeptide (TPR) repeat protein
LLAPGDYNAASVPGKQIYRFLGYELDPVQRVIARHGELLPMAPKVVDTLLVLVAHAGDVVDKQTLMGSVWPDTSVVESSLTRNISVLRKALAEGGNEDALIQTVSRRGYRFLPPVEIVSREDGAVQPNTRHAFPAVAPTEVVATRPWRWALLFIGVALAGGMVAFLMSGPPPISDRSGVLTEAEREYLLGRHFWNKVEPAHVERALRRFQRAAELDPGSALAHAGIADSHLLMIHLAMGNRSRSLEEARAAAQRAIELDPNLALPRISLGYVAAMSGLDLPSARREFERARELGAPAALPGYGDYLTWIGDLNGAREYFARARLIDPVSANIGTRAARLEYFARRYAHAIELLREVLEREPSFSLARYYLALSYAFEGRIDAALRELGQVHLNPNLLATDEAWILSRRGDLQPAQALIDERRKGVEAGTRKWTELLIPALSVGDQDLAIRVLEEMLKTQEIELLHLNVDPRFDPLRPDVRFQNLTTRVFGGG